jgi:hypothetical protein
MEKAPGRGKSAARGLYNFTLACGGKRFYVKSFAVNAGRVVNGFLWVCYFLVPCLQAKKTPRSLAP